MAMHLPPLSSHSTYAESFFLPSSSYLHPFDARERILSFRLAFASAATPFVLVVAFFSLVFCRSTNSIPSRVQAFQLVAQRMLKTGQSQFLSLSPSLYFSISRGAARERPFERGL